MTPPRPSPIRTVAAACLGALAAGVWSGPARAQPDARDAAHPWSMFAALPDSVDAAAVLDRPADLLLTDPAGRTARDLLVRTGLFAQTQRAWAGLSEALGYTQEEAARALLGRRVTVAWSGLTPAADNPNPGGPAGAAARADTRWLVIAEIDRGTAEAVRERLKPAPRRTVDGRVVYSIDTGRTAMALLDADDGHTHARVLIAPNQAVALLEATISGPIVPPRDAPARQDARQDARQAPPAPHPFATRPPVMLGATRPGWAAIAAVRLPGTPDPGVIELRTTGPAWGLRFAAPSQQTIANGAPIGVLSHINADAFLAAAFAEGPRFGPGGLDLQLNLASRQRPTETTPPESDAPDDPLDAARGAVVALLPAAGHEAPGDPQAAPPMVGQIITHAAAADSTPFPEQADRLMSVMVGGEHPPAHRGRFPGAVRTHTVESEASGADASGADKPASVWPGEHARVAWALATDAVAGSTQAGVLSIAFAPRWADPAPAALAGRHAWTAGQADADPTMLSAGWARPADLANLLARPTPGALQTLAASISRIEWTIRLRDGVARGEILLRLEQDPARLGSP